MGHRQWWILDESRHCSRDHDTDMASADHDLSENTLEYWLTKCTEATSRVPMRCFLDARACSTSSSCGSVAFGVMETWTYKLKYSLEGTRAGNTSFDLPCPPTGSFEPLSQEDHLVCIVRVYCSRDPCGTCTVCYLFSTKNCNGSTTETTSLQRRGIIDSLESEAARPIQARDLCVPPSHVSCSLVQPLTDRVLVLA